MKMKRIILSFVLLTAIAVLTSCTKTRAQEEINTKTEVQESVNARTEKWEYRIVELKKISSADNRLNKESELNRLGAEGWELVSIGSPASGGVNTGEFYGVLKRKL